MMLGERVAIFDGRRWCAAEIVSLVPESALVVLLASSRWACVPPQALRRVHVVHA